MSGELYRYMSFSEFVNMVQRRQLQLVSPLNWDDKYEGYLFRALKTEEGKKKIIKASLEYTNDATEAIYTLENVLPKVRCKCLTEKKDDVLMWNLYCYNNEAVMISVNREILENMKNISVEKLKYDSNDISLCEEINRIFDKKGIYFSEVFKCKRKMFEYENEVRIFSKPSTYAELMSINDTYDIDLNNIQSFINSVMVHPCASNWYCDTVKTFCEGNGIIFHGRSKIYSPII